MMGILLKGQPNNVPALYLRGKSYFYMDDQSMAKRHFGEALKYDPEHKEAKAEFTKVRSLYKKKAQVSQPHALLGSLHQCHADLLMQVGTVYLLLLPLTHHF
jgi:tetratricopeptide (TPR) repeat protein